MLKFVIKNHILEIPVYEIVLQAKDNYHREWNIE